MTYALAGEHLSLSQLGARDPTATPAVGSIIYVPAAGGGWAELVITVPGTANFQNVVATNTGDTTIAYKQHYDDTNPAQVSDSAATPGTSVISARRDHVHLASAASHAAVTLDADAAVLLDLSTQEIGLDTQSANTVFAGPTTGAANEPTFRALVDDDLPDHGAAEHDNRTRSAQIVIFSHPDNVIWVPLWLDAVDGRNNGFFFTVPSDYASGDITIKMLRRGAASGTAVMKYNAYRFRDATAFSQWATDVGVNFTPGDTNSHLLSITLAAANFTIGDGIRVDMQRTGNDASDTMTASVDCDGAWFEYTADM